MFVETFPKYRLGHRLLKLFGKHLVLYVKSTIKIHFFCMNSEVCGFVLEDKETGNLRTLSIGTGDGVAFEQWRLRRGESLIDSHALIIARRGLLVYFYEQLLNLIKREGESIFEFTGPDISTLVCLKEKYEIHLYTKNPPCGDACFFNAGSPQELALEVRGEHWSFFNSGSGRGHIVMKGNQQDLASCSDKILMWNYVGIQGALLSNFIAPIYINSITVSNLYSPTILTRAFCCRFDPRQIDGFRGINHPWMQHGEVEGIRNTRRCNDHRNRWSIYWSHEGMDLTDELINLTENAGIIDTGTGIHFVGSDRDGRIPVICKRNLLRNYRKVCLLAGAGVRFVHGKSYKEHKNMSVDYKMRKNEFFKHLDMTNLGRFPLMDRNVDDFYLHGDDQSEPPYK